MDIKISIELKDKYYGFSDLLDGRELNNQTKEEIIELIKEDIGYAFDQQIEVAAINYTHCCTELCDECSRENHLQKLTEQAQDLGLGYD